MEDLVSSPNDSDGYFSRRLDEIHLTDYERIKAKAHLARAEAMADFLFTALQALNRGLKPIGLGSAAPRPIRGPAPHAG
jgi:hypothetical protein